MSVLGTPSGPEASALRALKHLLVHQGGPSEPEASARKARPHRRPRGVFLADASGSEIEKTCVGEGPDIATLARASGYELLVCTPRAAGRRVAGPGGRSPRTPASRPRSRRRAS